MVAATFNRVLSANGNVPTGKQPRAFAIDPGGKFLYAVGEQSDSMIGYAIDTKTGTLSRN